MKKTLVGVLVVGFLVAADEKKPDDVNAKLKGSWTVVAMEKGGTKAPEDKYKGHVLTFDGDKNATFNNGKETMKGTYKLDGTKKPIELDITPADKKETMKMIVQIDGDTLKIAHGMGDARPKGFDDKEAMIMTLKRDKKNK